MKNNYHVLRVHVGSICFEICFFSAFKGLPTAEMDSLLLRISSALIAAYAHPDSRSF